MKRILSVITLILSLLLSACHADLPDDTKKTKETDPTTVTSATDITDTQPTTPLPSDPPPTDPPPTDPPPTDPPPTLPPPTDPPPTEPDPNALTEDEIAELQNLYEHPKYPTVASFYNVALGQTYSDPREIDLFRFFYNGDRFVWTITDEESAFIESAIQDAEYMGQYRAAPENMDVILQMCFGLSLQDMQGNGLDSFAYFEETGCYYNAATSPPSHAGSLKITGGTHLEDGNLQVFYTANNKNQYVMILKPVDGGYHILSNLEVAE